MIAKKGVGKWCRLSEEAGKHEPLHGDPVVLMICRIERNVGCYQKRPRRDTKGVGEDEVTVSSGLQRRRGKGGLY